MCKTNLLERNGLQLPPDILEVEESFFAAQPLGRSDGAFGEPAAGFCVVAQIDPVVGGIQNELVHADDVAFAERCDFESLSPEALDNFLQSSAVPEGASFFWA